MNALVIGLLSSTMLVSATGVKPGDYVFPSATPGQLKVNNQVVAEVSIVEYLKVLEVNGKWLWVESHDLVSDRANNKGWILASDVDNIQTQLAYFEDLTAKNPQNAAAFAVLGLIQQLASDTKSGINSLSHAIQIEPASDYYYFIRGILWAGINQLQKAFEDFQQAASLDPNEQMYKNAVAVAQQLVQASQTAQAQPAPPSKEVPFGARKSFKFATDKRGLDLRSLNKQALAGQASSQPRN